jgi:hypothetical protein
VNAILFFRRTATARARDFNWHNVIGFWCAPVLIVLTATGAVMSYPWANRALYQIAGSPLPAARERAPAAGGPQAAGSEGRGRPAGGAAERAGRGEGIRALPENVDRLWARAEQQLPTWQTVTMRLPERPRAPVSLTMNDARHWNAFARSQLALDAATGDIVRWEPYAEQSRGQKWRGWVRFGHTGELRHRRPGARAQPVPRRSGPPWDGPRRSRSAGSWAGGSGAGWRSRHGWRAAGGCSVARMNTNRLDASSQDWESADEGQRRGHRKVERGAP